MRRIILFLTFIIITVTASPVRGADPPNILWITAEDMSAALGCYGDEYAVTPNVDRFAEESVRYTRAFATAPVCSPSRSCLITGCYATSLGTQQMRSAFPIPDEMTGFPSILRKELGYYTSNNVKTDYNTANWEKIVEASWDDSSAEAHWRNRPDDSTPFFSVFNLMTSHQSRSMVWPYEKFVDEVQSKLDEDEIHDPEKAPLPPYYVDTPIVRREWARFYDCVTAMDKEVGAILEQLEEDGLAEDTIVFFFSDHGSGMPRHKRALFDTGMQVPLLIRVPEKFRDLAANDPGEDVDDLVSFVDFAPTVLTLAEAEIPDFMQGRPFLGMPGTRPPRQYIYGHRDRVDEARDLARSVRSPRWLYIRNYMPHLGYNQPTSWPDQGEIRHEFYRLSDPEKMTEAQWQFASPLRPAEELYDCEADPLNLENLAGVEEHEEVLEEMREAHRDHLDSTRDLGFIPESLAWKLFEGSTGWETGPELDLEAVYDAAARVGAADESELSEHLSSDDPSVRYWSALGLGARESLARPSLVELLKQYDREKVSAVQTEIAFALLRHSTVRTGLISLMAELKKDDLTAVLHAIRNLEMLGPKVALAASTVKDLRDRCYEIRPPDTPPTVVASGEQDLAMFIAMSANAFLDRLGENDPPEKKGNENKEDAKEEEEEEDNCEADEEDDPWLSLFDGESLEGWTALAEGEVSVENGEIHLLARGKNLWLIHDKEFENFELAAEVKMPEDNYNSGVGFRCARAKGKPKGYQCEVAGAITGKIYAIGSGWVWPKGKDQEQRFRKMAGDSFQPDDWNRLRIRCEGHRLRIWVNATLTADVRDTRFSKGAVALQHHGKGGVHRFRNIRLLELP